MYKVLVTGGTSGIGLAISDALRKLGYEVFTVARGERASVRCDVTVRSQVEQLRKQIGAIDVLINNAGGVRTAPFLKTDETDWDWHFELNVKSIFYCTQVFLPAMLEKKWGRIINVASTAGKIGGPYLSAYAASKHAVIGLTRSLAQEVAAQGITVNAICPSFVDTPMLREQSRKISEKTGKSVDELLDIYASRNPQKRLVMPQEVAATVEFLINNAAINGQAISLCGGETF